MNNDAPRITVVGSGPNGLTAAVLLQQAGCQVTVVEGYATPGGGMRTQELTLPGYRHDVCASALALTRGSRALRQIGIPLDGPDWVDAPFAMVHPFEEGPAAVLSRSVDETAASLGKDARAYRRLMGPFVSRAQMLINSILSPLPNPFHDPFLLARFGFAALRPSISLARGLFRGERARAFFAGLAAHSMLPLEQPMTSAFALGMAVVGHAFGWAVWRGGTQGFSDQLVNLFFSSGGSIVTNRWVCSRFDLPDGREVIWDLTPWQLLDIDGLEIPEGYRQRLSRFRYGAATFKLDYALDAPIPWKDPTCALTMCIHLGNSMEEIATSERGAHAGSPSDRPYVILIQPSLFDPSRAPVGKHTAWAYCHVPNGYTGDRTEAIERQIERFAPGFQSRILERHISSPAQIQAYNPNYVGGDINGGMQDLRQFFTRPVASLDPYHIPGTRMYLCSSSTPPGGGVHGMCGYYAARSALRRLKH